MALLITAILYSLSWGITFFNSNIIHYRSYTNDILAKYNHFNRILKCLNTLLFLIAIIAFIIEFGAKVTSKPFLIFLSEFVILVLLFVPITTLSFEYLYNKTFKWINRIYVGINTLFTIAYIIYPFFIVKILDIDDQSKILVSQSFLTIELYMFLVLFIYMIFLIYQTFSLSHKVLLIEQYIKRNPSYKLSKKLKDKKYRWIVPSVFSKTLLKEVLNNQKLYDLVLTKYRFLPNIKKGTSLTHLKKAKVKKRK